MKDTIVTCVYASCALTGDAEHAWERLGQSSVGLVEMLQPMQEQARAAGWTQQLLGAAAVGGVQAMETAGKRKGGGGAEGGDGDGTEAAIVRQQELLLQVVGLRLMLATMEANRA